MSKYEELIKQFCPNGVEYKKVSDVCDISRGQVMSKDYIKDNAGDYPVYSSQTENNGELGKINTYMYDGEYLTWTTDGANAGTVFYRTGKFSVTNVCGLLKVTTSQLLVKFLYYTLSVEAPKYVNSGMGNPKLMSNVMGRIKVPVPPIEVQREIVRILDNFTELTAELNEKLAAELTTRNKQYEYYRDSVLTFGDAVPTVKLKDVCISVKDGMHNLPKNSTEKGEFPILSAANINNGTIDYNAKRYVDEEVFNVENKRTNVEIGDVLLTIVATIGRTAVVNSNPNFLLQRSVCVLKVNKKILPGFLKYCLDTQKNQRNMIANAHGSAQAGLYLNQVAEIEIPLPPLEEQEHIVEILDRFDKLCNGITVGLPAEIEARQKQYEYYRDKLLTFKELKV